VSRTGQPQSPLGEPEAWNLVSQGYTDDVVPQFEAFAQRALRLASVTAGARIVDVACGPGTLAFAAAACGAHVSAVDFAEDMIAALHARARREGVKNIEARVGNGMALPYADASFDAGFSMFGLMFFPKRDAGFAELARVLRPGASAVVSSWQPLDREPIFGVTFAAIRDHLPDLPFGDDDTPLGEPEALRKEMLASGFNAVEVHEVAHAIEAPSLRAWWDSMQRSMVPIVFIRSRIGPARFQPIAESIYQRIASEFGEGPQKLQLAANFGVGKR
jgi:SAM-dependent methyltransferase